MLATQSIEARTQQERRVSLYDWIVYGRGSKARERKGEEEQRRSMFYTVLIINFKLVLDYGNLPVKLLLSSATNIGR